MLVGGPEQTSRLPQTHKSGWCLPGPPVHRDPTTKNPKDLTSASRPQSACSLCLESPSLPNPLGTSFFCGPRPPHPHPCSHHPPYRAFLADIIGWCPGDHTPTQASSEKPSIRALSLVGEGGWSRLAFSHRPFSPLLSTQSSSKVTSALGPHHPLLHSGLLPASPRPTRAVWIRLLVASLWATPAGCRGLLAHSSPSLFTWLLTHLLASGTDVPGPRPQLCHPFSSTHGSADTGISVQNQTPHSQHTSLGPSISPNPMADP